MTDLLPSPIPAADRADEAADLLRLYTDGLLPSTNARRICPPLVVSETDVDAAVAILDEALASA